MQQPGDGLGGCDTRQPPGVIRRDERAADPHPAVGTGVEFTEIEGDVGGCGPDSDDPLLTPGLGPIEGVAGGGTGDHGHHPAMAMRAS